MVRHANQGQSLAEYGLAIALIAVLAIAGLVALGGSLRGMMTQTGQNMNTPAQNSINAAQQALNNQGNPGGNGRTTGVIGAAPPGGGETPAITTSANSQETPALRIGGNGDSVVTTDPSSSNNEPPSANGG